MGTRLGPRFAVKAHVQKEWMQQSPLKKEQLLLEVAQKNEVLQVLCFSEAFKDKLFQNAQEDQWIYLGQVLREQEELLYAFESLKERNFFDALRELAGVGPKTAASLVGNLGIKGLYKLYKSSSKPTVKIPGIGPKTLEKISKLLKEDKARFEIFFINTESPENNETHLKSLDAEKTPELLRKGLEQLGLKASQVEKLYEELLQEQPELKNADIGSLMQLCLQRWGQYKNQTLFSSKGLS